MPSLLEVRGARKHFRLGGGLFRAPRKIRAVDGVDLDLEPEETLGLVGESGCGKTTLGRMIVGLEVPTAGSFSFRGEPLDHGAGQRTRDVRRMQMVFQDPYGSLNPRKRIGDAIGTPVRIHRVVDRGAVADRVAALLAEVGLPTAMAGRFPGQLSGGQQQRVAIARALSVEPELLVADEPLSALDVSVQAQVLRLLERIRAERRLSMLFISHDLAVVRYLCDRVAVMYLGRIVELAEKKTLFALPRHPYTSALLSAVPSTTHRRRERIVLSGEIPGAATIPAGCRFHPRCWKAQAVCREVDPPLARVGDSTVACHFPN